MSGIAETLCLALVFAKSFFMSRYISPVCPVDCFANTGGHKGLQNHGQ